MAHSGSRLAPVRSTSRRAAKDTPARKACSAASIISATKGGTYTYAGFGFDVNLGSNWVITPNGAAGFYQRGDGTKLGSWMEFRSGADIDYKFADQSRLGISFQHTSNAGLTKFNPGEQEVLLVYQLPLHW
jgi:lipid A 3-O-deacylase